MPKSKKSDLAVLRVKYAAYRRKQSVTPEKMESMLGFKAWVKQQNSKSE